MGSVSKPCCFIVCMVTFILKELEKERIEDRQVEMGESEEVLGVQCPAQYQDIDLKDVRLIDFPSLQ